MIKIGKKGINLKYMQLESPKKVLKINFESKNYVICDVSKLIMFAMKESFTRTPRIAFQSTAFSPKRRQIDSQASFTGAGGFAIERTSESCCFLIPRTANYQFYFFGSKI
jgi:hypothetical protein